MTDDVEPATVDDTARVSAPSRATRSRPGGYATGRAARERILEAAAAAFGEHGYPGASLADIGRAAGMTQQGVLHHFPSKVRLLIAVLEERDNRTMSAWPSDARITGLGVLDAWDDLVEHNSRHYREVRLAHVLCAEASVDGHPARQHFTEHFDMGYGMLLAGFQAGVEAGELRSDVDYATIARHVIAMSEGLETQWLTNPESIDIVRCFHAFTRELRDRIRRV